MYYFSKWSAVHFTEHVTTSTITSFLLAVFSREGYPEDIVTNNGPQFTSKEFRDFLCARGIRHTTVAVYHPQANELIERFNRVFKAYIQSAAIEERPLKSSVLEYLAVYRGTPQGTTGVAPSLLLHNRQLRTKLNIIGLPS